jgi:molybdopterin-guanine dinucleotide biosynthesis protein MobB
VKPPPILCVVGPSGSGKTTLLTRLIAALAGEGLRVGAVKHAAHGPQAGPDGKDSARLAAAGARPAVVAGPEGLIVHAPPRDLPLAELAETFCAGCDLVLAEGYRHGPHAKILLTGRGPPESLPGVGLVVSSAGPAGPGRLDRDDVAGIVGWIKGWLAAGGEPGGAADRPRR